MPRQVKCSKNSTCFFSIGISCYPITGSDSSPDCWKASGLCLVMLILMRFFQWVNRWRWAEASKCHPASPWCCLMFRAERGQVSDPVGRKTWFSFTHLKRAARIWTALCLFSDCFQTPLNIGWVPARRLPKLGVVSLPTNTVKFNYVSHWW